MHGVVPHWCSDRISHSLFLPEEDFADYLGRRSAPFVPLELALRGKGDALTIDDATYGSLRAACLARDYGHAVTWFINGIHIEYGLPYFPFQLSSMIDDTKNTACSFDGRKWELHHIEGRRALRLRLKQLYMKIKILDEIDDLVEAVSECTDVDPSKMERALNTVSADCLSDAIAAGVDLQNHGWTHFNPNCFSRTEFVSDINANEEYLGRHRHSASRIYAPPYGEEVGIACAPDLFDYVLLSNRRMSPVNSFGNQVNRTTLELREICPSQRPENPRTAGPELTK
jgi:peptidoglycan/xylan/chitin deacetylase (PgdA/CDA1 family)